MISTLTPIVTNPGTIATPVGPAAAFYTWAAPRVLNWLGGHRNTEDLVPGVSFPGYDDLGNPIEWTDIYQYADYFWPDGIPEGETETAPTRRTETPMQPLRLYIVTPQGIQSGRADYNDTVGIWFNSVLDLIGYAQQNGEMIQEVTTVEEAEAIKTGAVPANPQEPVIPESKSGLLLAAMAVLAGKKFFGL